LRSPTTNNVACWCCQSDPSFSERDAFVPETGEGHEIARRAEVLGIIRVARDGPRRFYSRQIWLAGHPRSAGDKPPDERIPRNLRRRGSPLTRLFSQVEAMLIVIWLRDSATATTTDVAASACDRLLGWLSQNVAAPPDGLAYTVGKAINEASPC
jgi:hypothetical protein